MVHNKISKKTLGLHIVVIQTLWGEYLDYEIERFDILFGVKVC